MVLKDLIDKAAGLQRKDPQLRYGQALMNALSELDKEIYDAITGTDADPFSQDARIGRFYSALTELQDTGGSDSRKKPAYRPGHP